MTLKITSLKVKERVSEQHTGEDIPYLIVNATWVVTDDKHLLDRFMRHSCLYEEAMSVENPRDDQFVYDWKKVWVTRDPLWIYLEKHNTFWLREYITDCTTTRAILADLHSYYKEGKLPSIHRCTEEFAVFRHLESLTRYWD